MALTVPQLQSNLDAINQALGNPTLRVRFPDGREVTYRSVDELRKAKAEIEEDIRELTGGVYFGKPKETRTLPDGDIQAVDTMVYRKSEIERITETAIATAAVAIVRMSPSTSPSVCGSSAITSGCEGSFGASSATSS